MPKSADTHRDPVYLAVGRAIEKWSWVETNLAVLLEGLMRHRRDGLVGAGFHAVVSFKDKLNMVNVIAQRTLSGKRLARWQKLSDKIGRKSQKRNQIAHFAIVMHGKTAATLQARLHPYWSVTKGVPANKNDGLTANDLEARAESFTRLSVEVLAFYRELPKRLRRTSKSAPSSP